MFITGSLYFKSFSAESFPRVRNDCFCVLSFLWQHLHAQYDELFPALCNDFPHIFPQELYTREKFIWACELWYSNSMKIMYPE